MKQEESRAVKYSRRSGRKTNQAADFGEHNGARENLQMAAEEEEDSMAASMTQ